MSAGGRRLAVVMLTCDRPDLFRRAVMDLHTSHLPAGWVRDITVVDNSEGAVGRAEVDRWLGNGAVDRLVRPTFNAGIAAGWNLGFGVADTEEPFSGRALPEVVALVQDDVAMDPDWFIECLQALDTWDDVALVSGYNSPSHPTLSVRRSRDLLGYEQAALPGVHLVARRAFWEGVFPLQTTQHHTDEDWEITRDSDGAPRNLGKLCLVVPGLVEHTGGQRSTYGNEHADYADPIREILADGARPSAEILDREEPQEAQESPETIEGGTPPSGPLAVLHERTESPEAFGLKDHFGFGFVGLDEAAQAMGAGMPVLLRGWREEYRPLVDAHGDRCVFTWNSGWTGAELMGEDAALSTLLALARKGRGKVLWWTGQDDLVPEGVSRWKPLWSPARFDDLGEAPARRPGSVLIGPHANPYSLCAKNGLASAVAASGQGYEIHVGEAMMSGPMSRSLQEVLRNENVVSHMRLPWDRLLKLLRSVWMTMHPSVVDTWPALAVASVYCGTPVLLSPEIVWHEGITSWNAAEVSVVTPASSTRRMRSSLGRVVDNPLTVASVAQAQRDTLDKLLAAHVSIDRDVLLGCGFSGDHV